MIIKPILLRHFTQRLDNYLDDLFNIDKNGQPNLSFLDLDLSFSNGLVYDKRNDFDFGIINVPFLDGDLLCHPSYGVFISQLIRFASVCSHVDV